jgi:hypothetical protein
MNLTIQEQQKIALGVLWKCFKFDKSKIALAAGVKRQAVYNWFRRGRISATAAANLEQHILVKGVITKEQMRPDVAEWFGV